MALNIVRIWVRERLVGRILATSDSNIAVDNLLPGLHQMGIRVIRIGRPAAIREDLQSLSLENVGAELVPEMRFLEQQKALGRAEVVCATCSGAASEILEKFQFGAVLLDEAAQCTEPSAIVSLTRGAGILVLCGDHKQLPPTIICREAEQDGLALSLFDRLAKRQEQAHAQQLQEQRLQLQHGVAPMTSLLPEQYAPLLLDVQYRSHPAIAHFPSLMFYEGRVRSGVSRSARPPPSGYTWPNPEVPIAFHPCNNAAEAREGVSYSNYSEAAEVHRIVSGLLGGQQASDCRRYGGRPPTLRPQDIGIVTPYASQVRCNTTHYLTVLCCVLVCTYIYIYDPTTNIFFCYCFFCLLFFLLI